MSFLLATSESTPQEKMLKARGRLVLEEPFFGSLAMKIKVVPSTRCKTMAIDGLNLFYNPEFISGIPDYDVDKIKGSIINCMLKVILRHHTRRGESRDPKTWQKASNRVTEANVVKYNHHLIDETHVDIHDADRTVEEVYTLIYDDECQNHGPDPNSPMPGDKPGNGSGQNKSGPQNKNQNQNQNQDQNQDQDQDQNNQPNDSPNGDVWDMPSPEDDSKDASDNEKLENEQEWEMGVHQADAIAKAMGNRPGDIERVIKEVNNPSRDWRDELREFIEKTGLFDYTWTKPNKRYLHQDLYLPSLYETEDQVAKALVYVDASGSVYDKQLEQFGAELSSILEEMPGVELVVKYFDTKIKHEDTKTYRHEDLPLELYTRAGGGTDFRVIFEDVESYMDEFLENYDDLKFVLIFTDMECNRFPKNHPDYPVLWGKVGSSGYASKAPFGSEIKITIKDKRGRK